MNRGGIFPMHFKNLLTFTLLLSGHVYGQSTIETSLGDLNSQIYNYAKEHFSASYHGEMYAVRRDVDSLEASDQKMNDIKIMHNPTLVYKPTKEWQVLATGEFKFSDQPSPGADYPNGFYRALFTLSRKSILNEKDHGIQLDAGIGRRQFNTGSAQAAGGQFALSSYGNNRVFATVTKTKGKHSASLFAQFLNNDYKKATATTWKNSVELIPTLNLQLTEKLSFLFNDDIVINTPKSNSTDRNVSVSHDMNLAVFTYQWNDKVSTYYQLKYGHTENFTNNFQTQDDFFNHFAGVSYSFTPKATVTFEVGSELARARDGKDLLSKKVTYPELALYVDYAI